MSLYISSNPKKNIQTNIQIQQNYSGPPPQKNLVFIPDFVPLVWVCLIGQLPNGLVVEALSVTHLEVKVIYFTTLLMSSIQPARGFLFRMS